VRPDEAEAVARTTGRVYVLAPFLGPRETFHHEHNVGTRILQRLDATYAFPEPYVREFLAQVEADAEEVRAWARLAWYGPCPPRRADTWERVWNVLIRARDKGATCAQVQAATGLGHGAVSAVLSRWDEAGVVRRIRPSDREG